MKRTTTGSCHAAARGASIGNAAYQIALVGNPNVGKSVVFNRLIGGTTTVSNYPGTTVEVFRGRFDTGTGIPMEVIDTPGMYTFSCITEEEGGAWTARCRRWTRLLCGSRRANDRAQPAERDAVRADHVRAREHHPEHGVPLQARREE